MGQRLANQSARPQVLISDWVEPAGIAHVRHDLTSLLARGVVIRWLGKGLDPPGDEVGDLRREIDMALVEKSADMLGIQHVHGITAADNFSRAPSRDDPRPKNIIRGSIIRII